MGTWTDDRFFHGEITGLEIPQVSEVILADTFVNVRRAPTPTIRRQDLAPRANHRCDCAGPTHQSERSRSGFRSRRAILYPHLDSRRTRAGAGDTLIIADKIDVAARPARVPGRETTLQEIAAGRRLPVDHFAGDENARQSFSASIVVVEFTPGNAARGGNRFLDGTRAAQPQREMLHSPNESVGIAQIVREETFEQGSCRGASTSTRETSHRDETYSRGERESPPRKVVASDRL